MATGIIAVTSGVATTTYTPSADTEVQIVVNGSGAATVTVQGIAGLFTASVLNVIKVFVGAGQTLTVVGVANAVIAISSLEGF